MTAETGSSSHANHLLSKVSIYTFFFFCSSVLLFNLFTDESRLPLFLLSLFAFSCMHQQSRMDDEPNCARASSGKHENAVFCTSVFFGFDIEFMIFTVSCLLFRVFWVVCAVGSLLWSTDIWPEVTCHSRTQKVSLASPSYLQSSFVFHHLFKTK